jgi:hypothetical protein
MSRSQSPDLTPERAHEQAREQAEFWFDPTCPWAWMTSRWMLEVTTMRPVDVTWNLFSLSVLNEGRELSESYSKRMVRAWRPIRVLAAALDKAGPQIVLPLYTAIGTRLHPGGRRDHDAVLAESLVEVGLPPDLAAAADTDERDHIFRESTARAIALVGDDVGTPIISVNGTAFFGPVVTPTPRGEAAARLWDGTIAVASVPGFYELKRSRTEEPSF